MSIFLTKRKIVHIFPMHLFLRDSRIILEDMSLFYLHCFPWLKGKNVKFGLNVYEDKACVYEVNAAIHSFQDIIEECLKLHN